MISITKRVFTKKPLQRCIHTSQIRRINHETVEEVRISVPWGHVAGKWWGKKDVQPIIAVHGIHENAGSWDPLCQLLPEDISVFAVDLPGHGCSSHLPPFQNYYHNDSIPILRRIKKHLGIDKADLLGHSEGSAMCFTYAAVFPEDVNSYIGVDYMTHCYMDDKERALSLGDFIDKKISLALRDPADSKTYEWEKARKKLIEGFPWSLTEKTADIIMQRGVERAADGRFRFSRDQRIKGYEPNVFNPEQTVKLAENIQCHVRLIKAKQSMFFETGLSLRPNLVDIVEKNAKSFRLYEMDGGHHLHMDAPEKFLPILLDISKTSSKSGAMSRS